jgi:hypothetical protein
LKVFEQSEPSVEEVDIGNPSPAVYMHVESEPSGRSVVVFVSCDGDTFCLERPQLNLRIRYLESKGMESTEERKALVALAAAGG